MNCQDYRRALLAEPHAGSPARAGHVAGCADCARYTEQVLTFEARLGEALHLPAKPRGAPAVAAPVTALRPPAGRRGRVRSGWWAAAASVLLAAAVAGGLWLAEPAPSLAADVVAHMAGEPAAWRVTQEPVNTPDLDAVLAASRLRLKGDAGLVTYASSCLFRAHRVPHLVVQTAAGPVTVMVLTHESARTPVAFDEQGYRGMIMPVPGHGSLAVLERSGTGAGAPGVAEDAAHPARGPMPAVEAVAARVRDALQWTG